MLFLKREIVSWSLYKLFLLHKQTNFVYTLEIGRLLLLERKERILGKSG